MESFIDGTIIKEALIIFYFCLAIGIMLQNIGLEHLIADFIRALFFNMGATLFCLRLIINRVYKYWLTESAIKYLEKGYAFYKTIWPKSVSQTSSNLSSEKLSYDENGDSPAYKQKTVLASDISELIIAIEDPSRLKILRDLAVKNHLVENVDFICGVLKFKEEAAQLIVNSSGVASDDIKTQAMAMWYQYLQINSPDEVNVCSTTREMLKAQLDQWAPNVTVIPKKIAHHLLQTDSEHRITIFEVAYREILKMLYQNLWTKFRVEEAKAYTLEKGEEDSEGIMFYLKGSQSNLNGCDKVSDKYISIKMQKESDLSIKMKSSAKYLSIKTQKESDLSIKIGAIVPDR